MGIFIALYQWQETAGNNALPAGFAISFLYFVGGVGFDINCGVRLLRTNLDESDVQPVKEQLAQAMFDHIPVGVGSKGVIPMNAK